MMVQRLKSLEQVSLGGSWALGEKLELTPVATPTMKSRAELEEARKEMKLDFTVKGGGQTQLG